MAPDIPSAELRLSYPLYAVDFDPQDANRLVVGGGGGAARSGVGNKASVLDAAHADSLQIESEIELSRDEDSINTVAVGPRTRDSVLFYAGVNSAESDLKKGKNEHFRVFSADLPSSKTKAGAAGSAKITEISRTALFSTTDTEAYQRLLRISGPVGAVATGTTGRAKDAQIVIFEMPTAGSSGGGGGGGPTPKLRGRLELPKEAMDMDMMQVSDDVHQLVYCDDYDMYTLNIGKSSTGGPHCVFTIALDEASGAKARPSFRCIRYLTSTFVLALANLPQASGAILQGFRLPNPADQGKEGSEGKARPIITARLPKSVARATGMAVRNLSPPSSAGARQGDTQFVVAVTGQDSSITVYTLELQTMGDIILLSNLHPVTTLKEVHQGPISGLAFSPFTPPSEPSSPSPRPPHLKLASIGSMGNTCVVHSLPLKQLVTSSSSSSSSSSEQKNTGDDAGRRYVLALKSRGPSPAGLVLFSAVFVALLALLLQAVLEVKGLARPVLGARHVTPVRWHSPPRYDFGGGGGDGDTDSSAPLLASYSRKSVLDRYREMVSEVGGRIAVVVRPGQGEAGDGEEEVVVAGVEEEGSGEDGDGARVWEELHPAQREAWKEKLKRAGHWGEEMGEAVLKGIVFGEIAGVVGAMVG